MEGSVLNSWLCVCVLLAGVLLPSTTAQSPISSTYGSEFYLGFMRGIGGVFLTDLQVTVGTPDDGTVSFVVESSSGVIHTGTVTSDSPVVVSIPSELQVTDSDFDNREKGVHVYSTGRGDDPPLLYVLGENFFVFLNYGVFIAYPCFSLGADVTEYEYHVISSDVSSQLYSEFLLVGCEDDTTITITPTQSIALPEDTQMTSTAVTIEPGTSKVITLGQMQTLLVLSFDDLSGTKITSNKPLTVLSGNECANVPLSEDGCEPFAVQVPPVATWGTAFLLAPFAGRDGPHFFKSVSSKNDTTLVLTCDSNVRFGRQNSVHELNSGAYCYLESTDPIFVAGHSFGGTADARGDPSISIVSPIDQYVNSIEFVSLPTDEFASNYISVTVAAEHYDPSSILLDGEVINCDWHQISNSSDDIVGYGCNTTVSSGSDTPTKHTVSHSNENGLLSVHVYGFSAFPAQGYAYLAGQVLKITEDDGRPGPNVTQPDLGNFLPFVDLSNIPEVQMLDNTQVDAFSDAIIIPLGLIFGDEIVTLAFVNENGVISFDKPYQFSLPNRFPTEYFWTRTGKAIAAFWSDNDIRKEGAVKYVSFTAAEAAQEANSSRQEWLDQVNSYIHNARQMNVSEEDRFQGTWVLTALWDHVHPSPHGEDDTTGFDNEDLEKFNSYQAVIVSNVTHTFAIFSYICGGIQWSALGRNRPAVVGYNSEGNEYNNHPLSGFSDIGDAISCSFGARRRKRQTPVEMDDGNTCIEDPPADDDLQERIRTCVQLLGFNSAVAVGANTPQLLTQLLDPCPCTLQQVREDIARFKDLQDALRPACYVSTKPVDTRIPNFGEITLTQKCCYDQANGNLYISTTDEVVGTMLFYHPTLDSARYNSRLGDEAFRRACCEIEVDMYCDMFYEQRPINDCEQPVPGYRPPGMAIGSGDPHYRTFDGVWHHFQGTGDYILLKIIPDFRNFDASIFTLQGRTQSNPGWSNGRTDVSSHAALAFGRPGLSFHFNKGFVLYDTANGCTDITNQLPMNDNVELTRSGNRLTATFFESGVILTAFAHSSGTFQWIDFTISVPTTFGARTLGFLGTIDGDRNNEFTQRDGLIVRVNDGRAISQHLETVWRIRDTDDSYFCTNRRKRQVEEPENRTQLFFDDLTITDTAREICEGSPACIFDLIVGGEDEAAEELAKITLNREKETNTTQEIINNFPPNITAARVFRVNVGEESLYFLTVVDPGDEFTLTVLGGLPTGSVLEDTGEGEYIFRWKLEAVSTEPLVFVASDVKGAFSTFTPIVEVCACANGGNCTRDGLLASNATTVLNCACSEAFSGAFCQEDRNGCSEIQCFDGVECLDVPSPGVGAVCGACPSGYTGDQAQSKCYDIDECALDASLCDQICENTDGNYTCSCMDGFELTGEGNRCLDVNECDGVNDCQQLCENTVGSYSCSCAAGFTLNDDGRSCNATEPCGGECSYQCAVIDGAEQCYCPSGFVLSEPNGVQCVDQNECDVSPCEQLCINTEGSFECACESGYQLIENQRNCADVDECFEAALASEVLCEDPNAACVNLEGSSECECVPGYIKINGTCHRVDPPPPPPPPPPLENSVNFTAPTLTPDDFTPAEQQNFRVVTSEIINSFCGVRICTIVLLNREFEEITELKIEPANVAIPPALIDQDVNGQLKFEFFIQTSHGSLLREQIMSALEEKKSDIRYRKAGFLPPLDCPPLCTPELCRADRRALCTIPEPETECDCAFCRLTFCHTCYYAAVTRPIPAECDRHACEAYPELAQANDKCFRRWSICVRRDDKKRHPKADVTTLERFKCYEHPCL